MNAFAFALTPAVPLNHLADELRARWSLLPKWDRRAVAGGALTAPVLLVALALTCQASVLKGERLRAEQRQAASPAMTVPGQARVVAALSCPRADHISASGPHNTPAASSV